jgi:hypothetical protein
LTDNFSFFAAHRKGSVCFGGTVTKAVHYCIAVFGLDVGAVRILAAPMRAITKVTAIAFGHLRQSAIF